MMIYLCMVPSGPAPSGKVKVTMVPCSPSSGAMLIVPPWRSTIDLDRNRPEPDPLALGGEERFEHALGDVGIDAGAVVSEGYHEAVAFLMERDAEFAAVGHRLDRVGDHVDEAHADFFRVDVEHGRHTVDFLDQLHALRAHLRFGDLQDAIDQSAHVGRRRMNLDRLAVVEETLHQLGEAANLVLHQRDLMDIGVGVGLDPARILGAHLIEREADEVERIFYFMRQAAGELAERGETLEAIELGLALARVTQLLDHLVEAMRQKPDLVATLALGHRLQPARHDVLRRRGDRMNRLDVTLGEEVRDYQSGREDHDREGQLTQPALRQRLREVAEVRHHAHIAEQMIFDLDRNQVNGLLGAAQLHRRNIAAVASLDDVGASRARSSAAPRR